jgi:hypothetical protein
VHTALLTRSLGDKFLASYPAPSSFAGRFSLHHLQTSLLDAVPFGDRFFQRRWTGLRKRVVTAQKLWEKTGKMRS